MKRSFLFAVVLAGLSILTACQPSQSILQIGVELEPTPTPRGKDFGKLAYIQGGDVWVKALPDGKPQRLTQDGNNQDPRWSPKGNWLAFHKGDFSVWLIYASGNLARPLNEGARVDAFAWSPNKDSLAYASGGSIMIVDADGRKAVPLLPQGNPGDTQDVEDQINRIAWNPDGNMIAYEWKRQQNGQPSGESGIRMISLDGNPTKEVYQGDASLVGWTSDGRSLLFWENVFSSASLASDGVSLYAWSPEGNTPVKLVDMILAYPDFVAFDPGGTDRLIVVSGSDRQAWTNKMLVFIKAGAEESSPLTSTTMAVSSPAWSADGTQIAFVSAPDPKSQEMLQGDAAHQVLMQRRIWIVGVQGNSKPRQLTTDADYRDERPLWSNDGSFILFARFDQEDRASLWLVSTEAGKPIQAVDELTPNPGSFGFYGHVEWDGLYDWWRGASNPTSTYPLATTTSAANLTSETVAILSTATQILAPTSSLIPTSAPIVTFSPEIYPSPHPILGATDINARGCPDLRSVEMANQLPVETALKVINEWGSGDLNSVKQASDQSGWPTQTFLFPWEPVHSSDVKIYPASRSAYARSIRTGCGQETLDRSWAAQVGEAELAENYFFIKRLGHWLVWATYP